MSKKTKMKITGAKLAAATLVSISLYLFWKKNKQILTSFTPMQKKPDDFFNTFEKYKPYNSFIEFFDAKNTEEAYSKYKKYMDFGMGKDNAFKSVIENRFNND